MISSRDLRRKKSRSIPTVRIVQTARQWGGVEHNNTQLAAHLIRRGIATTITAIGANTYSRMPSRYAEEVELEEIAWPRDPYAYPLTFAEWYRILRARPAEVGVFPKSWWSKGGLAMISAARLVYPRVIVREEGGPVIPRPAKRTLLGVLPRPPLWYYRHLAYGRLLSTLPNYSVCVSNITRDRLVYGCGYPPGRTVTVHNGVDSSLFRFVPEQRAAYRERLGIPEQAVVLGAIGRVDNIHKRHDVSLRLFAELVRERPAHDLHFLLVGEGPDVQAMREMSVDLGVAGRVTFAPFTSAPWEAHCALDVFLIPSCSESFGIALIEAMACERCVIGTAIEGIAEIMDRDDIGFCVPLGDDQALLASMREAVDMGAEGRAKLGARARASVVARFEATQQYGKIIDLILPE